MKTVVIWDELQGELQFAIVDGDRSELDGTYINAQPNNEIDAQNQENLGYLMFDEDWEIRQEMLDKFPTEAVKEGAIVITAGFLP